MEEKKGEEKEEVKKNEEKFALCWDKYFKNQIEILKDLDWFKVENELKNIEEKQKNYNELILKTELENRKKKPIDETPGGDDEKSGKNSLKNLEHKVVKKFNILWDELLNPHNLKIDDFKKKMINEIVDIQKRIR